MTGEQSKFFYLPPMTDLTPSAQAVLNAYGSSPLINNHVLDHRHCLAAAIRALAYNVYSDEVVTCGGSSYALVIERDDILAIADELEDVKYGTYRCNLEDKPQ
jgi:hypothetical protein